MYFLRQALPSTIFFRYSGELKSQPIPCIIYYYTNFVLLYTVFTSGHIVLLDIFDCMNIMSKKNLKYEKSHKELSLEPEKKRIIILKLFFNYLY